MPEYSDSEAHVCQFLTRFATDRRHCTVTVNGDRRKNGMEFFQGVMSVARGLRLLGIKPGHIVSTCALNSDLYLEWMLAICFVGGISVPLNYRWSLEEAKSAMEVARPVLLVTDSSAGFWFSNFKFDFVPFPMRHVLMGTTIEVSAIELNEEPSSQLDYCWAPERVAIICFTSGTTGRPKGVAISHSALNVQSLAKIAIVGYNENDVYLHTTPLCHIGGISSALAMLMAGGCHVIIPKFDSKLASEAIHEHKVSALITVPTLMADLIMSKRTEKKSDTFTSVTKILNGGGGLSAELTRAAIEIFPKATLISAYGMTEACSSLTFLTHYDPTKELDIKTNIMGGTCVGKPAPHVELKVESGGRILMRGPHAMLGYWDIQSSSDYCSNERWIDTGDVGHIDNHGSLWLVGRARGKIKSGGENIYPEEVEGVISQHPGILSNVVVGLPDSRLTEMVVACIKLKHGWRWVEENDSSVNHSEELFQCLSSHILKHFCHQKHLTRFKIPKSFILWSGIDFPKTATGKIRRDQVKAHVMPHYHCHASKL